MDQSESDHAQTNRTIGSIEVTSISSPTVSSSYIDHDPASTFTNHHHHPNHNAVPHSLRRTPMFLPTGTPASSSATTTTGAAGSAATAVPHHLSSSLRNNNAHHNHHHHHHHNRNSSGGGGHNGHNITSAHSTSTHSTSNASSHQHLQSSSPHRSRRTTAGDPNNPAAADTATLSANMIKSGLYPVSGNKRR